MERYDVMSTQLEKVNEIFDTQLEYGKHHIGRKLDTMLKKRTLSKDEEAAVAALKSTLAEMSRLLGRVNARFANRKRKADTASSSSGTALDGAALATASAALSQIEDERAAASYHASNFGHRLDGMRLSQSPFAESEAPVAGPSTDAGTSSSAGLATHPDWLQDYGDDDDDDDHDDEDDGRNDQPDLVEAILKDSAGGCSTTLQQCAGQRVAKMAFLLSLLKGQEMVSCTSTDRCTEWSRLS
ncbi:unnamed protein product [Jaminaea pallidilutea]